MKTEDMERAIAEVWKLFENTAKQLDKLEKQAEKTEKQVEKTSHSVNKLTSKWGNFVESLVAPSLVRVFGERGIELTHVARNITAKRGGEQIEIDVLGVNGEYAVVVEVKSTLGNEDVDQTISALEKFKGYFPEYANRKILGAVAGIVIDSEADKYAYRKGLFVLVQSGDTIKIANDEGFKPREW